MLRNPNLNVRSMVSLPNHGAIKNIWTATLYRVKKNCIWVLQAFSWIGWKANYVSLQYYYSTNV